MIAALLALALAHRAAILCTGQRWLRSDEAAVGLMAKHIVTRGERPLFLYGQPYGGGHAMTAYVAAPLFAAFGRSAVLLTAIPVLWSTLSAWLLWRLMSCRFAPEVALAATALYAFSPPVLYQAFLVNGGAEAFLAALAALFFFWRYLDGAPAGRSGLLAGLFCGLAVYAMDYTLVYAAVFALLWAASPAPARARFALALIAGFLVGCMPMIVFDLTHNFAHFKWLFGIGATGTPTRPFGHFLGALGGLMTGDLAAFFGGDIDEFQPAPPGAWFHAAAALIAFSVIIWRFRGFIVSKAKGRLFASSGPAWPPALIPAAFLLVYAGMYGLASFSHPALRSPRYLLPLCPFVSICIAVAALHGARPRARLIGAALVGLLVISGAVQSLRIGMRPWHEEHRIVTRGPDMHRLACYVRQHHIRYAFAPYEIQWRLMFATDEAITVSSQSLSPSPRYAPYDDEVIKAVSDGNTFAFIFRNDFAFVQWANTLSGGWFTRNAVEQACRLANVPPQGVEVGEEFVVYYPLDVEFLQALRVVFGQQNAGDGD